MTEDFGKNYQLTLTLFGPVFFDVFFLKNKLKKTVYIVMFSSHL